MDETPPRLPNLPLISGLYHVVPLDEDRVQIANAGRSVVLKGKGFAAKVAPLIDALDGTHTVDELQQLFPDLVPALLDGLLKKGLLVEGDPDGDLAPAALTATALTEFAPLPEVRHMLEDATVTFIGCGPVSATAAIHLAKAGVGRLVLADDGAITHHEVIVSPHLNRSATGTRRVEALRQLCTAAGTPTVDIVSSPLPRKLIQPSTLLVLECRYGKAPCAPPEADAALSLGIPYMLHSQDALEAIVGPVIRPGGAPCHHCLDARRIGHVNDLDEFYTYREHRGTLQHMPDAFLAAHTSFLGSLVATESLRVVVKAAQSTQGGALIVDLATMAAEREEVLLVPACSGCATALHSD